jgi:TetR/AcrR family transcriptional regulator, tetracycline repressor protein
MDRPTAENAADVLTSYVNGYTIEEQARKPNQRTAADRGFTFGLNLVLAGLRTIPTA